MEWTQYTNSAGQDVGEFSITIPPFWGVWLVCYISIDFSMKNDLYVVVVYRTYNVFSTIYYLLLQMLFKFAWTFNSWMYNDILYSIK